MGPFESLVEANLSGWSTGDVIDAETASLLVKQLRGSGKNRGFGDSPSRDTGPLIFGRFPIDVLKNRRNSDGESYFDFLVSTTDADRVAKYARASIQRPVYLVMNRRKLVVVSDGGHRTVAADLRGDTHVPAVMEPEIFNKYRSRIK